MYPCQSTGTNYLQTSNHERDSDVQSAINPTPRSPDPGYLEALNGYFPQSHFDYTPSEEYPDDDFNTEDEEDRDVQCDDGENSRRTQYLAPNGYWERRRSCSLHEVLSSSRTPLISPMTPKVISPANERVITSPSPYSKIPDTSRRRRHSCVEPNTKEFHTLATIFGWVTMSAQDAWPKILGKQFDQTTEINTVIPTESCINAHPTMYESDDNFYSDGGFRYGEMMEWSLSRESRDSEFSESCFQSPVYSPGFSNGSTELLSEFRSLDRDASLVHQEGECLSKYQPQSSQRRLSEALRGHQAPDSITSKEKDVGIIDLNSPPAFDSSRDFAKSQSLRNDIPLCIDVLPREQFCDRNQRLKSSPTISDNPIKIGRRQKSLEFSLLCETACSNKIRFEGPFDSGASRNSEHSLMSPQSLMSPHSFSSGKDSGYMSISCGSLNSPVYPSAIDIEQDATDKPKERTCLPVEPEEKINSVLECKNTETSSYDAKSMADTAPVSHIPPRCPENEAQGFDHAEDEGPDTIVYAPFESGQLPGNCGLRPIVAATVAKLIEKLTHQYGMDSGFLSDFFLTYRLFMSPMQLCKYLIKRYLWSLEQDTGMRHIVRVRTFVVIRYWINKHFEDDFLPSKALRFQMESFLREVRSNPKVQSSDFDSRIIHSLSDFYKRQRRDYKAMAERRLLEGQRHFSEREGDQGVGYSDLGHSEKEDRKTAEVERTGVSTVHGHFEPSATKPVSNDFASAKRPIKAKGRHRASTLASITSRSMVREAHGCSTNYKIPPSNESRATPMTRQVSEGGAMMPRERRLSTSSIKTHRSGGTWSSKVTIGINKLRQKSEDIYQQLVNSANTSIKSGENRTCVCWTPSYTGISDHHALNTARSHPNLRPSVIVANVSQEISLPPSLGGHAGSGNPSNKSIKRLRSSISLGRVLPATEPPLASSPTKNSFSSASARHSRSNSNSSAGYHPNPDCPYHIECLDVFGIDIAKVTQDTTGEDRSATLQEALDDEFADILTRTPRSRVQTSISSSHGFNPWFTLPQPNSTIPAYKPFILYYRSQSIAQQLCLLEQHFLEKIRWDELLEVELTKAGRRNKSKCQFSIGGYMFKTDRERRGVDASNERSNMLCMWVASEVVSTHPIEERVRVIEKFIRIARKCHQYKNYNSLFHLVMGLGSSHLCKMRRTWSRVRAYEMKILQELQGFISPYSNWGVIRKAMSEVDYQETLDPVKIISTQGPDSASKSRSNSVTELTSSIQHLLNESGYSRYPSGHSTTNEQGCIPFLGLFVFDLTHISVSPPWYLPQTDVEESRPQDLLSYLPQSMATTSNSNISSRLQVPEPKDVQKLIPTGTLLVHFHRKNY
ncbi:hypothetical protein BGZ46_009564 [Entomortierella lignicola]|nr:hypothetical protein BGZ46_009564 [Entomortierella lignicola]